VTFGVSEPAGPVEPDDGRGPGLARVLERGRARGWLSMDDLDELIRTADLTVDYIDALRASVQAEGIRWVEEQDVEAEADLVELIAVVAQVVEDEEAAAEVAVVEPAAADIAEPPPVVTRVRSRRPRRDGDDDGAGPYADLVRMYLGEIGKVPLLNAGEEVELAQRIEKGTQAAARLAEL
jgi:RNA polymerase primary sigma factor